MTRFLIAILFALIILPSVVFGQAEDIDEEEDTGMEINYRISPSLGMTYQSMSRSVDDETSELHWLFGLQSSLNIDSEDWQFAGTLFMQYGQLHSKGDFPLKTQDNLIISLMPFVDLIKSINVKAFLETSARTTIRDGEIDGYPTKAFDPIFLYQTLFLGQRFNIISDEDGYSAFDLIYGLGYAVQETITDEFVLEENRDFEIGPDNPLSNVQDRITLESGFSAVFKLNYTNEFTDDLSFNGQAWFVAFTKNSFFEDIENSTASGIITAGLSYRYFSLDYSFNLMYDSNFSKRRQLDQTLVFGLRFDI